MTSFGKVLCSIPSASLSILLYLFSAPDGLLLTKAVGVSMLLSGDISLGHFMPFLLCSRASPSPTPDVAI